MSAPSLAEKLSGLKIRKQEDRVIQILKILEPRLEDLMVAHRGSAPMIFGDVKLSRYLPVFSSRRRHRKIAGNCVIR